MLKSTEGLSIWFILIWLGGDAFNFVGGILQGVLPTMVRRIKVCSLVQISLAGYYCLCDLMLIWQWWYYGKYYRHGKPIATHDTEQQERVSGDAHERTPLMRREDERESRVQHVMRRLGAYVSRVADRFSAEQLVFLKYSFICALVLVTCIVAYVTADEHMEPKTGRREPGMHLRWDAQLLGWLSALLYLLSRVPQIFKNRHTKCAGLSLALFIFALGGNVTYVLSILLSDTSAGYLVENMSWLVGSVGTIFLDFIVLHQFVKYAPERRALEDALRQAH